MNNLRRTYIKEIKGHRITLRFFRHPKKKEKAASPMKRLRTIAKTLIRDLDRHFDDTQHSAIVKSFISLCEYCFKRESHAIKFTPSMNLISTLWQKAKTIRATNTELKRLSSPPIPTGTSWALLLFFRNK